MRNHPFIPSEEGNPAPNKDDEVTEFLAALDAQWPDRKRRDDDNQRVHDLLARIPYAKAIAMLPEAIRIAGCYSRPTVRNLALAFRRAREAAKGDLAAAETDRLLADQRERHRRAEREKALVARYRARWASLLPDERQRRMDAAHNVPSSMHPAVVPGLTWLIEYQAILLYANEIERGDSGAE